MRRRKDAENAKDVSVYMEISLRLGVFASGFHDYLNGHGALGSHTGMPMNAYHGAMMQMP
jgi:hypothetical protein